VSRSRNCSWSDGIYLKSKYIVTYLSLYIFLRFPKILKQIKLSVEFSIHSGQCCTKILKFPFFFSPPRKATVGQSVSFLMPMALLHLSPKINRIHHHSLPIRAGAHAVQRYTYLSSLYNLITVVYFIYFLCHTRHDFLYWSDISKVSRSTYMSCAHMYDH
jgi:hypothetical protein